MSGNPGGKDQFYYSVSEFERRKNPNITNQEVADKVNTYRQNPEKFHAMAYKEMSGGKIIDKKTLQRAAEFDGTTYDPNKLSPNEINFVDNEKIDILSDYSKIQKISSDIDLPLDATDAEIEKHAIKRMQGRPINNYELEKELAVKNLKKKMNDLRETQKVYTEKIGKTELTPIPVEDFFADARKKTNKTNIIKAFKDEGDFFSGNDAEEELTNANIQSEKYIKVLEEQTKLRLNLIKDPKEKQIASAIISNKKPQVEDDFKPSKELDAFVKAYDSYNQQYNINATQFGSIIDNKKKTYNQQLAENRQKKQVEVDKEQSWISKKDLVSFIPGVGPIASIFIKEVPSVAQTWVSSAIEGMFGGAIDVGNAFYSNELESKIKEAKKAGNTDEYLNLQRKLALVKFKLNNNKMEQTLQRTDITQPLYEDRKTVDGFKLQVNSRGEFIRMVDIDGKTVHTLSPAQQKAVEKYQENPDAYETESGWSTGWYKSLANSVGKTTVEMIPMIVGGVATAPLKSMGMIGAATSKVVPMLPMFMSSYHDNFTERFEKTGDWSTSSFYGTAMASLEAIPEFMFGIEPKVLSRLTANGVTSEAVKTAGQRAIDIVSNSTDLYRQSFFKTFSKELAKDVGSELAEEFFTLYSQSAVNKMFGEDSNVSLNDVLTTLLVTPLATAPMSSITNINNYKANSDFKSMILAAASDYEKTAELMTEAVYSNKKFQENRLAKGLGLTNFVNKINEEDVKKKLDLVKAVAARKDNYSQRSAGMNISFTEKENSKLEDYMFEEAVGEINGKKVDYTKEVDAIIAAATKRSKTEAATEKNDPIIPIETEDDGDERMKRPLRYNRRSKNEKGYVVEETVGPDGSYSTVSNDENIQEGEISLNFNITNDDAEILSSEIQDIAAAEGIPLKMDVAKGDNNTDVPLRVSFNSPEHAQIVHDKLKSSPYYNQMVPQKTDRILGKKIDEKVQFGVRNLKDIRKAQDIIENSTRNENGTYTYSQDGMEETMSKEDYDVFEEILFAADNMWQSSTPQAPVQEAPQPSAPLNELRALVSERTPQAEPQTRTIDERGFERLNIKSDANLQDAFDYTDGDKKEIPVFRNGQKGVLRVDEGGAMEFDNGKQIIEYGNINDQRTSTLSELGFTLPEDFKVKNGNIVIDGELYQNPYSSPDAAITRDEDGNIVSVELEKREIRGGYNGIQVNDTLTPVTFTGQRAVDVATILMENELATNQKLREEFEAFPAPDIQPSFVPNNVTVDQLGDILLDYFPNKPALAMETAKIYFAQAVRMSTLFPQQYPTPAAYISEKINKDTVHNITEVEKLKTFINGIINTTDNQDRIDFAQRALDNINRINAIKIQTPQELITEINSKPLSHISLGPGVGMGQNEANGTYLSTESGGNRYEIIKTPGAKIYSAKVKITNPYDLDANMDDINSLRNRNLPDAIQRYTADNKLTGDLKKQIESINSIDNDLSQIFPGLDQYIADAVTLDLQNKGYDSLYSRKSNTREGYIVVFDKNNVQLIEQKFEEKTIKRNKIINNGYNFYSKLGKLIDKMGGPGSNVRLNAMLAITAGNISKKSFLKDVLVNGETEANLLTKARILSIKPDAISIEKAAENTEADNLLLRDEIINLLLSYNTNPVTGTYQQWVEELELYTKDPLEMVFEDDAEFIEEMERQRLAEIEAEIYDNIPEELYADIIDIENVQFSPEEIANFEDIFNTLPEAAPMEKILSVLPFDPEFEFINEQIENKIDEQTNADSEVADQAADGEVVAGQKSNSDGQADDDRQEVADQRPKVVDEIDRVQKLEQATNQLVSAKKELKKLEKEASEYKSNLEKNANQNQPNLFGELQPTLGFDNLSEQANKLKEKEEQKNTQREAVNNIEQEVEKLRDLKNQSEIDFDNPNSDTPVVDNADEIAKIKWEIDELMDKINKEWYPGYGADARLIGVLRDRLKELEPKVSDIKEEVSKKKEKVKKVEDLKKKIKKEPISDIDRELNDVGKEFMDIFNELKNIKSNLGIYSDPQKEAELQAKLLSKGIQLVDLYIRKGVTEFGEMVRQAVLQFGEMTDEFVDAMKMAYTSAMIKGRDLSTKFDDVKSYNLDKVINKIEDGQRRINGDVNGSSQRKPKSKVQPTNQGQLPFGIPEQEGRQMPEIDKSVTGEVGYERIGSRGSSNIGNVGDDIIYTTVDYFEIDEDIRPFNSSTRFNENIAAIELLATLYEEGRPATLDEKEILSKYVGFGGLKVILNDPNQQWNETDEKLRPQYNQLIQSIRRLEKETGYNGLLDDMKSSVLNAHFTAIPIIKSMYSILDRMGFKGGTILEPSSGVGNFIGAMPLSIRSKSKITSIEKEPVTGMINRLLYPETSTIINGFEDSGIRNNSQDIVVSNIPFGDYKVYDKTLSSDQKKIANNIHNYFFVKAVNTVREGGIIAFITSTGVMDSPGNRNTREFLAKNTNFLGAFRLPNSAFRSNANTSVTTDIIFLQKNTVNPSSNYNFINNQELNVNDNKSVNINEYFVQNPNAIIGELASIRGLYKENEMVVTAPKEMDIAQELIQRAETLLPKGIYQKGSVSKQEVSIDGNISPNTIYVKDGIVQFNNILGEAKTLPKSITAKQAEDFIKLRDVLTELYYESLNSPNSNRVNDLRNELNIAYDTFVSMHGKLSTQKNLPLIRDDAKGVYIKTLEKDGKKSDIFTKNTINSNDIPEINNFNDALVYSLQQNGSVDINFISELLDKPVGQIVEENYANYIFDDGYGNIVTREEYLSGNVKAKLKQAIQLAKTRPIMQKNAEELKKVIPVDLNALQIEVNIGARWVNPKYYEDFLNEILNNKQTKVIYAKGTDEYAVDGPYTVESTTKYGTDKISAYKIFSKTLEGRTPVVTYKNADGQQVVDRDATDAAIEKQNLIKEAFDSWIWRDLERREELSSLYNELYNTTVKRNYDGSHLTMPGLSNYKLRPHQKDAIWMIMQNNGGIIDHQVGAGKSLVLIAGAMELKRTGIAKKPIVVGLKSTIPHLVSDARKAYPMAKILAPNESAFSPANRKALFANIANNDYDIIIMSHEQFGKIPQNPYLLRELMEEELDLIEKEIRGIDMSNQLGKAAAKGLEKRKENIEAKIKELADMDKDDVLTFDKTGIDHIMVDESQQFKNLEYTTKVQGIAGLGDPKGSKRSFNMLTAIRQLQQNNGADKGTTFLSGTPISNSMVEMYLLLKYLRPSKMKELGFDTFDGWAKQFARESSDLEFTVAGTISNKTRFREFINVPELSMMYNEIADVRNDSNLKLDKPEADEQLVVIKQSQDQKDFTQMLVDFANTGTAPSGLRLGPTTDAMKKSKMLLVTGLSSKAAIDLRLVFPDATDNPTGKLQVAADKITEIYNNTKYDKGTQLLFSDIGTPKSGNLIEDLKDLLEDTYKINSNDLGLIFNNESDPEKQNNITQIKKKLSEVLEYDNLTIEDLIQEAKESSNVKFTVYAEMKKKLIENGVNPEEIAFIHDYKSDKQKSQLFEKVNSGEIRIVIGSTQKLGTGVNVQERIVAMHHIDVPWRPSDMEQRNGRGIRQGNYLAKEKYDNNVQIFKYGTEQTLDAYKYQLLDIKGKFISQVKDGSITDRIIEEDDSNESAKIIAALSGNPLIYDKAVLEKKIDKLNRVRKNHAIEVSNAENGIKSNTKIIESSNRLLEEIRQDSIVLNQGFRTIVIDSKEEKLPTITVGGMELEKDEKGKYKDIGKKIISAKNQILNKPVGHQQEIATINNLPLYAKLNKNQLDGSFSTDLFIKGKGIYIVSDSNDPGSQAAAITRFVSDFEKRTNKLKLDLITAKERLKSYETFLSEKGVWEGSEELMEAQIELQRIKKELDKDKNNNEVSEQVDTTIRQALDEMIRNGQVIVVNGITGEPCS